MIFVGTGVGIGFATGVFGGKPSDDAVEASTSAQPQKTPESSSPVPPTFNKAAHSLDDPGSVWVVVNKLRALQPSSYEPPDLVTVPVDHTNVPKLRAEASVAATELFAAAAAENLSLIAQSAFRNHSQQTRIYDEDVVANGEPYASSYTARPGFSEHQTGLAIDIGAANGSCSFRDCLAELPEGHWLAANAWRFGFILRYPADKTQITGFAFEPWHFRYVGMLLATEMHDTGIRTLEEFFDLGPAPTYR